MNVSRINKYGGVGRASPKKAGKAGAGGPSFETANTSSAKATGSTGSPNALASVDALLALQAVPDALEGRRKIVRRGQNLLDILEDIKIAVLSGGVPQQHLSRLLNILNMRRDAVADPNLIDVIDEIELRARVELAKFGHIAA